MIQLKFRSPSGEERPWKLREIIEGQPLGHPSHPMFVHFPVAFYIGALAFDLMTRLFEFPGLVQAATFLIIGAFAGSLFAVPTGLVDWWQMAKGSEKRRKATQHMLLQFATFGIFVVVLALRWGDRNTAREADILWIVLEAIGVAILTVGQYIGGILVYQMAMRVRTTRRTPTPTPPAAAAPPTSQTAPPSTSG
jgi:uncharacterized membrane protein